MAAHETAMTDCVKGSFRGLQNDFTLKTISKQMWGKRIFPVDYLVGLI